MKLLKLSYIIFYIRLIQVSQTCLPREKRDYLGEYDNLNFKEKNPISSDKLTKNILNLTNQIG
jgi:hypothetical protein